MEGVAHHGLVVGDQPGQHERGPGPDVGSLDRRTRQARHAPHHGVVSLGADVGTHAPELVDIAEPAPEEVLGDDADTVGNREHRHQEGLVVRSDPRVRQGGYVDRAAGARGRHQQACRGGRDVDTHGAELLDEHVEVLGPTALDDGLSPRQPDGGQERGRFDTVGDHPVIDRTQLVDPLDLDA